MLKIAILHTNDDTGELIEEWHPTDFKEALHEAALKRGWTGNGKKLAKAVDELVDEVLAAKQADSIHMP